VGSRDGAQNDGNNDIGNTIRNGRLLRLGLKGGLQWRGSSRDERG